MVTFNNSQSIRDPVLPKPEVKGLLDDRPGGQVNLLPEALTHGDLKVWFPVPRHSDPTKKEETVELFSDDNPTPIASRAWHIPIEDTDRYVVIPQQWLRNHDGENRLHYRFTIYNGESDLSFDLVMTLNTQAPVLATDSKLTFPTDVLPPANKLTARYLEQHNDEVKAAIPVYTTPRPWDRITWYWGETRGNLNKGGVIELDDKNYSDPLVLTIPGQLIRDRKDGIRYVWYQLHDRAGNESRPSEPVELNVAATPIPRTLPPSKPKEATGGTSSGVLKPGAANNGVTVTIPIDAVIYPGEEVFLQWAEPGTVGAYRTNTPVTPGSLDYKIPKEKIAQHLGKTLPVYYEVFDPGVVTPHQSQRYSLRVEDLTGTPTVQCAKVSGGKLSLASLTTGFADFTLESWAFMATDQYLTVTVEGVSATNSQKLVIPVLTESPVPQVAQVIPVGRISKADLQRFKLNVGFEVRVKVSFDNKQTWKSFPPLIPTLIA